MIKWGILGAGNIAHRFADSLLHDSNNELVAISVRDKEKGEAFAKKYEVEKVLSHEELINDPEIEAVYLALPHHLHKEYAIKLLENKKAVLCEKPAALNSKEVEEIAEVAKKNNTLFMEAMKPRFVPAYKEIKKLIDRGAIGNVWRIQTSLCNEMDFEAHKNTYHTQKEGGGALLDVGIYCASLLQDYFGNNFKVTKSKVEEKDGIDYYAAADIDFGDGNYGSIETAFDRESDREALIMGMDGLIIVEDLHRPEYFTVINPEGSRDYAYIYDYDDFYSEIEHFTNLLKKGEVESPIMSFSDSVNTARIIDLIKENKKLP